jgi:radical SAM superfamily enzyme YgiQ (UPF0313 family)
MKYEGMIYRPPSEADSLILQVAVGCSYNKCTFCHSFQDKSFRVKSFDEIREDIDEAALYGRIPRIFLADGNALDMPHEDMVRILEYLKLKIQGLKRVGVYANAADILKKDPGDLRELKELGLGIIYLGLESGNAEVLKRIRKNATAEQMIDAARRVREADILLSLTVLLGVGGVELSREHARDTGKVLSAMDPDYVGALSLMIVPGTPVHAELRAGRFEMPSPFGLIKELEEMVAGCDFTSCFFASNHASNYLSLRIRMPEEKQNALEHIRAVLDRGDPAVLRPEYLRGL